MAYSRQQIQHLFQSQFNQTAWTDFIINFFKAQTLRRVPEPLDIDQSEGQGYYWGKLTTTDDYEISFFYLKMNRAIDQRRVGLRQLVNRYIKIDSDAGIAVFDDGSHWRLSFITDMRGEKTSPKRYTFVFGDTSKYYHTAVDRFMDLQRIGISYKNIREAFSVEALTKQFYNDLFEWYTWALDPTTGVYFPNNPNTNADDTHQLDTKLIRLITRLMFVWFIKQKDLVPANLFDSEELKLYLKDFDPMSMDSANYYQGILQNLFFATLNRPIKNVTYDKDGHEIVERRGFAHLKDKPDVKSLYRYQELFKISEEQITRLFEFIPFINGGLFECLDKNKTSDGVDQAYYDDGFSRNTTIRDGHWTRRAFVPN
ncbi:MAG: restriction endonuclease, partial [Prevotella sp.]|nr:restriction endonuclease [Prevotella sp.]